jgi:hypothetical protein
MLVRYGRVAGAIGLAGLLLALLGADPAQAGCEPTWGVRFSTPQIVSASAGVLIGQIDAPEPPPPGTFLPHGLLLQIEPGLGGGKLSVGYATGLLPYAAGGLKLSALRTWGHPLVAKPHATYVGIEAEASFFIKLSVGVMRRVGGNPASSRTMLTGGIGLAF